MFIRLNVQILEQKLIFKYDVNLNHHLLNCAFMFAYKCNRKFFKKYSYSNTFETDVFVFIFVFMKMKNIRI